MNLEKAHQAAHVCFPEAYRAATQRIPVFVELRKHGSGKPVKWAPPQLTRVTLAEASHSLTITGSRVGWVIGSNLNRVDLDIVYTFEPGGEPWFTFNLGKGRGRRGAHLDVLPHFGGVRFDG
ncbi:hypothetical protein FDI14_gp084 [Mycobacterium phage SirDuracell]|uniref:Uncharacterized protein n=1 Tax=Mycobacterium phage SirDuracell TaxID=1034116 RepID=G1D5U9_9CAUD|nr:hypothetical protein FDI14_gp084 [Mycobacterium phage SirDuracell]AEK10149.1 hypothetical protein PBI_SIRDURACELL_84 [Mycobacterium phage SirDuracell]